MKTSTKSVPTATVISKALNSLKFNPKKEPILGILTDVQSLDYYMSGAIIDVSEANTYGLQQSAAMHKKVDDAITKLVLAKIMLEAD